MQLLLAIVQAEDADDLQDRLVAQEIRLTRINTVGGFLARGNVTVLIGVEDEQVKRVLATIRATCRTRLVAANPLPLAPEPYMSLTTAMPLDVEVGGATVFAFPVKRFLRLRLAPDGSARRIGEVVEEPRQRRGEDSMNLVLAIVQNEDAGPVTQGLLEAGHRVTRINTAGGFLKRGNATLLIGVEEDKVDNVLHLIESNCRSRSEPSSPRSDMPVYNATVFVLEASLFARL